MLPLFLTVVLIVFLPLIEASGEPPYSRDPSAWEEVQKPPKSRLADHMVWFYAANYSTSEWRVSLNSEGRPAAELSTGERAIRGMKPPFSPQAGKFKGAYAAVPVSDGWLVGFNKGEFGAALYWFSGDGARSSKISDHQVVEFIRRGDGIYAVEGLAHLHISKGSVIKIEQGEEQWAAAAFAELPYAPQAVSLSKDGDMLITLSGGIVSVGQDAKAEMLLEDESLGGLYPSSSVISEDGRKLYIGMRQYVGELDLESRKLRHLVPSLHYLNILPLEAQQRLRSQYSQPSSQPR